MNYKDISDEILIKNYIDGDEAAFNALVKRYLPLIYGYVRHYTGNVNNASDIVQEIFVKVWKNIKRFDRDKKFKTWFFAIAKNTCIDWLRQKNDLSSSVVDLENDKTLPDALIDSGSLEAVVDKNFILENLPSEQREIISLHFLERLTFREISELLKKPLNTVKSKYRRGIETVRKRMDEGNAPK